MKTISTKDAPAAIGPYSQAVVHNDQVYLSGQIGIDHQGEFAGDSLEAQTAQIFRNIEAVLKAAGSDLSKVLKTTIFLTDMADFATVNELYGKAFGDHRPARSTIAVSGLPKGAKVEIEVLATT